MSLQQANGSDVASDVTPFDAREPERMAANRSAELLLRAIKKLLKDGGSVDCHNLHTP
jgi:hypothetical protein